MIIRTVTFDRAALNALQNQQQYDAFILQRALSAKGKWDAHLAERKRKSDWASLQVSRYLKLTTPLPKGTKRAVTFERADAFDTPTPTSTCTSPV